MPKSDTWPGGVAMETLSNMDSAGSCDSVISVNSACSDDSMEHLSAEERACLMFLEETIESLELEEDSGLSNDELDGGQHIKTTPQQPFAPSNIKTTPQQPSVPDDIKTTPQQPSVPDDIKTTPQQPIITHDAQGFQHDETGRDHKSFLSGGVPTPFLLANEGASLPERPSADIAEPKTADEPTEPTSAALSVEHVAQRQAPPHEDADPQTSADVDDANAPTMTADTREQEVSPDLQTQAADPATDNRTPSPAAPSTGSDSATGVIDGDKGTEDVPADASPGGHDTGASEVDLGLIPPPSDFMDEPSRPTTPQPGAEDQKDQKDQLLDSTGTSATSSITPTDVEDLGSIASMKTPSPVSSPVSPDPPSKPAVEVPVSANAPPSPSEMPPPNPPPEAVEIKSPPAVAPRPKKLPSNIILKSHRPASGSNGTSAHPVSSSSDRLILDPQRVRMEALRKLGLLKSEERDPGPPVLSPNNRSPGSRRSWAAPSAPLSPNPAPHVPASSTPSPLPVPTVNPPSASVPVPTINPPSASVPAPTINPPSASVPAPTINPPSASVPVPTINPPSASVPVPTINPPSASVPVPTINPLSASVPVPTINPPSASVPVPTINPPSASVPVPTINPPSASVHVPSETPRRTVPPPTAVEVSLVDSSAVRDHGHILPAPAAFSDAAEPLTPPTDPIPVGDVSEHAGSDPAAPKKRSATLERSGMGLSGYAASQKSNGSVGAQRGPSEVRNTRARPASLGSGKDFSEAQGGYQGSQPATHHHPHPHPHLAGDPQKLPRSHGISVVICPRAKNGEDRREALKKLGLLRD